MFKYKRKVTQIGLDIGTSGIKFIQLSGVSDNLSLTKFDSVKVEKKLEGQKKALMDIAGTLSSKEVNISISGPSVIVRYVELPKMTDEELKSSMKFEAGKYIPFDMKDVMLDCQIVENIGHGRIRVLLVAAKKDLVTERIKLVESAGLSVKLVDCDSFAIANSFLLNFPDLNEKDNAALLNIGEKITSINILKGRIAYFTRELQIGGRDFTNSISQKLSLDTKDASKLVENPEARLEELSEVVKPIIAHMVEEIRLSLNYYENQIGVAVDKIYLSGGLSVFKGLVDILKESLGVDCMLWDPAKVLNIDKNVSRDKLGKIKNQLAVAVGLAIRG